MSALNGVFVVGATRSGIERNPITGSQLYYNGGSSHWSPHGHKLVQAPVAPPETLPPGLNGWVATTIIPAEADVVRQRRLAARRPSLYNPLLALRRAPVDSNAPMGNQPVQLSAAQWLGGSSQLGSSQPLANELMVLPALSGLPAGLGAPGIRSRAECHGGAFKQLLANRAKVGNGYLIGSYPEREGSKVFHTVALAGLGGTILGRYRATHLSDSETVWASPGDAPLVVATPLGCIGLATVGDLAVPELVGLYQTLRTDRLAAPAGEPSPLQLEIDPRLYG